MKAVATLVAIVALMCAIGGFVERRRHAETPETPAAPMVAALLPSKVELENVLSDGKPAPAANAGAIAVGQNWTSGPSGDAGRSQVASSLPPETTGMPMTCVGDTASPPRSSETERCTADAEIVLPATPSPAAAANRSTSSESIEDSAPPPVSDPGDELERQLDSVPIESAISLLWADFKTKCASEADYDWHAVKARLDSIATRRPELGSGGSLRWSALKHEVDRHGVLQTAWEKARAEADSLGSWRDSAIRASMIDRLRAYEQAHLLDFTGELARRRCAQLVEALVDPRERSE